MISISGKKSTKDWWQARIEDLKGKTQDAKEIFSSFVKNPEEIEDKDCFGEWTFLKLVSLSYCIDIYTNIAKKYFSKIYYVDLFAGSGFVKIKRINEIIAGSALIGKIAPKEDKQFDELILVEIDETKAKNLKTILPEAQIICDDANSDSTVEIITTILKNNQNYHSFIFIDPYNLEIHWKTLECLLDLKCDIIINYMEKAVIRDRGKAYSNKVTKNERESARKRLEAFYGENLGDLIRKDTTTGDMFDFYVEKIKKYRKITIPIRIEGLSGGFHYYMIFATRKTRGEQGWLEPIKELRKKIEKANDKLTKRWFEIYKGEQSTLDKFIEKN